MAIWPLHRRRSHDHRARFALGIVIVADHPGYHPGDRPRS
jgi:hypothetical protein